MKFIVVVHGALRDTLAEVLITKNNMALTKLFEKPQRITQLFGKNPKMYEKFGLKWHNWIDYGTPIGTTLLACLEGTIEVWNDHKSYGKYIKIFKTRSDWISEVIYWHLSEIKVKTGQIVKPWDIIGKTGNTGNSTWPHLHFGLRFRDTKKNVINKDNGFSGWIDPIPYFEK